MIIVPGSRKEFRGRPVQFAALPGWSGSAALLRLCLVEEEEDGIYAEPF